MGFDEGSEAPEASLKGGESLILTQYFELPGIVHTKTLIYLNISDS